MKKKYLSQREQWDPLKRNLGNQGLCHRASFKTDVHSLETMVNLLLKMLVALWGEGSRSYWQSLVLVT